MCFDFTVLAVDESDNEPDIKHNAEVWKTIHGPLKTKDQETQTEDTETQGTVYFDFSIQYLLFWGSNNICSYWLDQDKSLW